ncbi:hypothetical protein ACPYO6_08365 [Georgenia sp. Z1344]|uniref:hypothetical protein n=1 Tax=Georgenia sp. Z1344 TaxID=3416706 RepID=UPI003CF60678
MDYVIALVPPIGLLIALVVIVRAFLGADRSEREAEKAFRERHPDLDLAPLPASPSSVAGALAAEERAASEQGAVKGARGRPAGSADAGGASVAPGRSGAPERPESSVR